mgnify:CR=1 FL=1
MSLYRLSVTSKIDIYILHNNIVTVSQSNINVLKYSFDMRTKENNLFVACRIGENLLTI